METVYNIIEVVNSWRNLCDKYPVAGMIMFTFFLIGVIGVIHVIRYDINKNL